MLLSTYDYNILSFFLGVAPYNVTLIQQFQSTSCTLPLDPPLLSVVIARRAAHRLPMNDHLALFLDGGVVIFTRRYSRANHT